MIIRKNYWRLLELMIRLKNKNLKMLGIFINVFRVDFYFVVFKRDIENIMI